MKRVRLVISGDVIGVGFRAWVRRLAQDNHLTGWVKNREDNTVEIVAEGNEQQLQQLIKMCQRGPDVAWVEAVSVSWLPARHDFLDFTVVY
jgi:acylphosphatase